MNRVSVIKDEVPKVMKSIRQLIGKQVLVGIPEDTTGRDAENGPVTNALIGYVMEFGSPANNVPARPTLIPGTQKALPACLPVLEKAADASLKGESRAADKLLDAAGQLAEDSVKHEIANGNFVPLAPATIRARKYARQTQSRRQSEEHYLQLIKSGMSPEGAQNATGIRPLINTAQFLKSVTHVVRKR